MLVTVGSPAAHAVDRLLEEARGHAVTYAPVGATLGTDLPEGYRHDHWSVPLGHGGAAFDRAVVGLEQWEGHRHAGITVYPVGVRPEQGADVAIAIPVGAVRLTVVNRIVAVVRGDRRFAVVYGTLPGHGEEGEEAFVINRHDDDSVTFDIDAFSRPAGLARLGAPAVRLLQVRATDLYLKGIRQFVKGDGT